MKEGPRLTSFPESQSSPKQAAPGEPSEVELRAYSQAAWIGQAEQQQWGIKEDYLLSGVWEIQPHQGSKPCTATP